MGPDFYDYFLGGGHNRFSLFSDIWHPNALGHVVMAHLWHNAINPGDAGLTAVHPERPGAVHDLHPI
jgi:hypothetical protein